MNISGRANAALRHLALSACIGIAVLAIALAGLGFLIAAFYVWLSQHVGTAAAAASTGVVLLLIAMVTGWIGMVIVRKVKKPQPGLLAEFGGTFGLGLRLASMVVRRDPKKAVILAAVSGALAEYILSESGK